MKRNNYIVILVFLIFFAISFLTNILGAINPNVSDSFSLTGTMTGLLPFSFFLAYAIMSIPSGMIVQKYAEKISLVLAWSLAFSGALLFSLFPNFTVFLFSLFLIGCGMALLQVTLLPLLRISGGEEHFAFNSVIVQLVFGIASFCSPLLYSYLISGLGNPLNSGGIFLDLMDTLTPEQLPWVSIYWIFAMISFAMITVVIFVRFPIVVRNENEIVGAWDTHLELFRMRTVRLFFLGIFAYVGVEQGIANWISEFLRSYHQINPETDGAAIVGLFWGMMTIGCVVGLIMLKIADSKVVLRIFTIAALILLAFTLFGNRQFALFGFPAMGFSISVMYAIIFSLALNSIPKYHGSFSGILCTGIAGGAAFSLLIGKLKDLIGLRYGMLILFVPLIYILSLSIWAKPLISNVTLRKKTLTP